MPNTPFIDLIRTQTTAESHLLNHLIEQQPALNLEQLSRGRGIPFLQSIPAPPHHAFLASLNSQQSPAIDPYLSFFERNEPGRPNSHFLEAISLLSSRNETSTRLINLINQSSRVLNNVEINEHIRQLLNAIEQRPDTPVAHGHETGETLHTAVRESWQSLYHRFRQGALSIEAFLGLGAGHNRSYEGTPGDEAHTARARQAASDAALFLMPHLLLRTKAELIGVIDSLIDYVKAIPEASLRRKAKFAVDRLLRDNENDATTQVKSRQLIIASWHYLQSLDGGPNASELNTFLLGLSAYIDSGDYPNAPTGDVSTGLNFTLGVFQGDEEVRSDKGLDPACYGRLRNLCSSMVAIHHGVIANERMEVSPVGAVLSEGKMIGSQQAHWTSQAVSFLRFLHEKVENMPEDLFPKLIVAFDDGGFKREDEAIFTQWFHANGMQRDTSSLQTSMSIIGTLTDTLSDRSSYLDNATNANYFRNIDDCVVLIEGIKHSQRQTEQFTLDRSYGR